jgi:predicted RNA polymerase sigma factor
LHWAADGIPDKPRGWLRQTAARRFIDLTHSEQARRQREEQAARQPPPGTTPAQDGTLFLCCHPALAPTSQVAPTLRAAGGLSTAEIARAYLVPEATIADGSTEACAPPTARSRCTCPWT